MMQVLVVDDSPAIRKVARRILELMEFGVCEAADGRAALEQCAAAMPYVILLDWTMPEMDCFEFLKALRKMPGGALPKVVFCTTENEVGYIARALNAGADGHMMKPFDEHIMRGKFEEMGLV
jgi:two-component system, chemotaxis family, chemotaxis protein CheY